MQGVHADAVAVYMAAGEAAILCTFVWYSYIVKDAGNYVKSYATDVEYLTIYYNNFHKKCNICERFNKHFVV